MRRVNKHDTDELRRIGEWLNAAHPTDQGSDGDRVIAAADEIDWLRHCIHMIGRQDPPLFLNDAVRDTLNDCIRNPPSSPKLAEDNRITSAEQFEAMVAEAKQAQR